MLIIIEGLKGAKKKHIADLLCDRSTEITKVSFPNTWPILSELQKPDFDIVKYVSGEVEKFKEKVAQAQNNEIILSIRYYYSILIFCELNNIDVTELDSILKTLPVPDCKIYLDVAPEVSIAHSIPDERCENVEREKALRSKIRQRYHEFTEQEGDWYRFNISHNVFDSATEIEQLISRLWKITVDDR